MAIVAGIDEAGYGPVLGPLVVSAVAFDVPDDCLGQSLWQALAGSVADRFHRNDCRLVIADSKLLYDRHTGVKWLERAALTVLEALGAPVRSFSDLLRQAAPSARAMFEEYEWYRGFDCPLPAACDPADIRIQAHALRRTMQERGMRLAAVMCEPLAEGHFNRRLASTRNKASVSMELVLRLIKRAADLEDGPICHIFIDKQGGRQFYLPQLMMAFEPQAPRIVEETAECSIYELDFGARTWRIEFAEACESKRLPVAMAAIYSKYIRELWMRSFNAFWQSHIADLEPTAGYYNDGLRFLSDIGAAVARLGVDMSLLRRAR